MPENFEGKRVLTITVVGSETFCTIFLMPLSVTANMWFVIGKIDHQDRFRGSIEALDAIEFFW